MNWFSESTRFRRVLPVAACGVALILAMAGAWVSVSLLIIAYVLCAALYVAVEQARQPGSDFLRRRWFVSAVFIAAGFFSLLMVTLVPPLQTPDAGSHLQRAYSLQEGQFLIRKNSRQAPANQQVDASFDSYLRAWLKQLAMKPQSRVTPQIEQAMHRVSFAGNEVAVFNGAAAYFPVLYAPSALGLGLAKSLDQPVWAGVRWARIAMLCAGLIACGLALVVARWGLYTMAAVMVLPITLSQLAGANLDAMTISYGLLAVALLSCGVLGGRHGEQVWPLWVQAAGWLLVALLALTKPVFIALLGPPLVWSILRREERGNLFWILGILAAVGLWVLHMSHNFVDIRVIKPQSSMEALRNALVSPFDTTMLVIKTLNVMSERYWLQLVGMLGWNDTLLTPRTYTFSALLLASAVVADGLSSNPAKAVDRVWFLGSFIGYLVLVMLVMLSAWMPIENGVIQGVQGRYFLPVLPLLAGVLGIGSSRLARFGCWVFVPVLAAYLLFLMSELPRILLFRFWL